jgi:glutaredoxin
MLKILLWPFRVIMGALILAYDRLARPKPLARPVERQAQVDAQTRSLTLYHMEACPFCVKVRRHIRRLGLSIELRDIKRHPEHEAELLEGGGEDQVPCLRIRSEGAPDRWMYESSDINAYLSERFGGSPV